MLQHFLNNVKEFPSQLFITDHVRGEQKRYTNEDLLGYVLSAAEKLLNLGVGNGDRVLITLRSSVEWVILDFASQLIGAIPASLSHEASENHKRNFIKIISPSLIIAEEGCHSLREPGVHSFTIRQFMDGVVRSDNMKLVESYIFDMDSPLYLASTSGTTGGYKACIISYRNALESCRAFVNSIPLTDSDKNLVFLPLSSVFP